MDVDNGLWGAVATIVGAVLREGGCCRGQGCGTKGRDYQCGRGHGNGGVASAVYVGNWLWGGITVVDKAVWRAEGVTVVDEAAGHGGEAVATDEAAGTAKLPPLWTWAISRGERPPPWTRPRGGRVRAL